MMNSPASPTTTLPKDANARQRALDPQASFAVSAPAGSGKTGLLTQRVLTLLAYCDEPEEVLAITFTRKAAGEMQERILQALLLAKEPEPEAEHARLTWRLAKKVLDRDLEKKWNLLKNPQRLRVQTIDSLCRSITKQLPLASGLGAQPDTLESADQAYRLAVRETLALVEKENFLQDDLKRLMRHLDNNLPAIENLLVTLLSKREQWLDVLFQARHEGARHYLESILEDVICEHLERTTLAIAHNASDLCIIADKAASNLAETPATKGSIVQLKGITRLPSANAQGLPQWLQITELLLVSAGTLRIRLTKNEGFPAGKDGAALKEEFAILVSHLLETEPDIANLLKQIRTLPPAHYQDDEWAIVDSLTRVLPVLAAQLKIVFKQLSATDFTEITQAALTALGDEDSPSDIALQLDYKIRHILVDEFQDTASPQMRLLERLTAGWQHDDGRTLFIVGDGMQSCYGFRNANVGLFLQARSQGIGSVPLQALDLTVNFRSQAGIVEWVNQTFEQAFPAENDITRGAVSYSPSDFSKPKLDYPAVSFYGLSYTNEEKSTEEEELSSSAIIKAQQDEAAAVVATVTTRWQEDPTANIAILVRTRGHLRQILPALSKAGLSWQATDIDSLASRMAIVDVMSLTRALLNPADRIAWLAILRAPWCGLNLHDLHLIANYRLDTVNPINQPQDFPNLWLQITHYEYITGLSYEGAAALARLVAVLKPALADRARKPLRTWVEGIWLALGGPALLADAQDELNLPSFFSLLEQHQQGGIIPDWEAFNLAVTQLYAKPRADANPLLQVMTIHKSKGLEFDTVIIPGLDRSPRNDDKQLLLWHERISPQGETQLLLSPLAATGNDDGLLYRYLRQELALQQDYEATRLLYVGCTRAINRLILLGCVKEKDEQPQAPNRSALLARIWPTMEYAIEPAPKLAAQDQNQPFFSHRLNHILRLPAAWQTPPLPDVNLLAPYRGHEFSDDENVPTIDSEANRLARHSGTILHRALQRIVQLGSLDTILNTGIDNYISAQMAFFERHLKASGWRDDRLKQGILKIAHALAETLQDPQGQWILNAQHQASACELPLQYFQNGGLKESIIDRTFISEGIRWVIDYKTSEPTQEQSREAFIADQIAVYLPQLNRYRRCFEELAEYPVRTALYFPMLSHEKFIEVDVKAPNLLEK